MDYYPLTDSEIASEIGQRLKALRLRQNITQKMLSEHTTLSLNSIKALEVGKGKLLTCIMILRALGKLDQIGQFIPEPSISPMQLVRQRDKARQRASKRKPK